MTELPTPEDILLLLLSPFFHVLDLVKKPKYVLFSSEV